MRDLRSLSFLPAALFLAGILTATAASAERLPPNPLTGGWQAMSGDEKWVSSDCIGERSSPQCVVDTYYACSFFTATRGFMEAVTDPDWIGGFHPVCDSLRRTPGNEIENEFPFLPGMGADTVTFYKLIILPFDLKTIPENLSLLLGGRPGDLLALPIVVPCDIPPPCDHVAEGSKPPGSTYNPKCLSQCEELQKILGLILRQRDNGLWYLIGVYGENHRGDIDWPYLHGFYHGLWYGEGREEAR